MSACEPCWNEAFRKSRALGGSQVDYYRLLIEMHATCPATTNRPPETDEENADG